MANITIIIPEFVLDCEIIPGQRGLTVAALVIVYMVSIVGNMLVIIVIKMNHKLHSPMFIFIGNLAVLDLANSTIIIPKMIAVIHFDSTVISYTGCIVQMYGILNLEQMVALLLAFMAVDRYVAVVYPLRYPSIITKKLVWISVSVLPIFAFLILLSYLVFATELSFCQTNVLPYCLCDYATLVHTSCNTDPKYLSLLSIMVLVLGVGPLLLILCSYVRIVIAALNIKAGDRNSKVFSTCVTHLVVVLCFYLPPLGSYILPGSGLQVSSAGYNAVFIAGNVVPPMVNPVIYSFRNKEIKSSIYGLLTGKRINQEITHH
ncbi:olfactory receptor 1500-like [Erpetoichthys calabaricus]|nr:olfactory receptor 1500-like [Erpetoichthys calabaricus]